MAIHQIQLRAHEREDRLLLRLSTTEGAEFRFWLTRRFVKQLWPLLIRMAGWDRAVRQQVNPGTRREVLEIQHEGYARQSDFSRGFDEAPRTYPLGDQPVLLCSARGVRRNEGLYVLSLYPGQGQGLDMTLDTRLLHVLGKLIQDAAAKADWGLALELEGVPSGAEGAIAAPRSLN